MEWQKNKTEALTLEIFLLHAHTESQKLKLLYNEAVQQKHLNIPFKN